MCRSRVWNACSQVIRAHPPGTRTEPFTFHLEKPSVSLVIRTPFNAEARPQYSYLKPFVAHDPSAQPALMARRLDLLKMLHEIGHPDYLHHLEALVAKSDFETAFWALERAYPVLSGADFTRLLQKADGRHGYFFEVCLLVLQEMRRADAIRDLVLLAEKPEHRLLLALLLGLPDRTSIFEFIRTHYDADPVEIITGWVREIAAAGEDGRNALGVHFDDLSLLVLECLLRGLSFEATKERLETEYDPDDVRSQEGELRELFSAFQSSSVLRPLFLVRQTSAVEIKPRRLEFNRTEPVADKVEAAMRHRFFCFLDDQRRI